MGGNPVVRLSPTWLPLVICVVVLHLSNPAYGLIGNTEGAFGLDGSIRTFFFLIDDQHNFPILGDDELDVFSQTVLRLTAGGHPNDTLSYEVHWLLDLTASTSQLDASFDLPLTVSVAPRYRIIDATWNLVEEDQVQCTSLFDRFNVKTAFDWGDLTIGRQAITFGKAYFWNPLDIFFSFGSNQFDREYKPGVDALRLDLPFGLFSGFSLIGAPGARLDIRNAEGEQPTPADATWYGSALTGRLFTNYHDWDIALQAGKVYGGVQLGAGIVGDVGPLQLRGEIAQLWAQDSDPLPFPLQGDQVVSGLSAVAGAGHRFENSLTLDIEYFYNGLSDPNQLDADLVRTLIGSSLQVSQHLIGFLASYEFTPLVFGQLAVIQSLSDGSAQIQPLLRISLSDEMELLLGANLNFGEEPERIAPGITEIQSEFGTFPHNAFFEWKFYF